MRSLNMSVGGATPPELHRTIRIPDARSDVYRPGRAIARRFASPDIARWRRKYTPQYSTKLPCAPING